MMMEEPEYYIFTGREGEVIPDHVTHVLIDKALKFVRASAFARHRKIIEMICHDGVEKIEEYAFNGCRSLRRVIIPGVKVIERNAFTPHVSVHGINCCGALTYIGGDKLERIGRSAFAACYSLRSFKMPSAAIVMRYAFAGCTKLRSARFGKDLESLGEMAFHNCHSLRRIALPLRDGIISDDNIFKGCDDLIQVDIVGGVHETVAALLLDEWKNEMNEEIDSINQILPNTPAGTDRYMDNGGKAQEIRSWIRSVLRKIIHYKAEHRSYLDEAAATLQSSLPNDIVHKSILPFLELPSYTFQGETSD